MTPATSVPRSRLSPEERRSQLIGLGLEMLRDRALHELSVDELASAAGISKALVFHYFGSKTDLLQAIAAAAAEEFIAVTEPDPALPLDEQLEQSMAAFVRYVADNQVGYVMLVRGPASTDDAMRELFERTRTRVVERIISKLGPLDPAPPGFALVVRGWVAFAEEVTTTWVSDPSVDEDVVLALLRDSLTSLVELVLADPLGRAGA
ncbi:TetR/AcrR family transcriptional regulator [Aquihabitans daechungensis]|uniref:TetR/AcrR family transcriptional regulator n=1 Tax=Aquihabitans daechungensis TaxID=1052257 RepID=UPI003BA323D2